MLSRRFLLQSAGAAMTLTAAPSRLADAAGAEITARLARYMVAARDQALPDAVVAASKHRILDTFAAMVSGSRMTPGLMAVKYVASLGGTEQASVIASGFRTTAVNAALANAMCAHADETDDFEPVTKAHPGCSTIPAALAVAETERRSGQDLIRAVTLGYDLACRLLTALGPDLVRGSTSRACALRSPMPRSRSPDCGAGPRTRTMSRRRSTSPAWVRATASLPSAWCRPA